MNKWLETPISIVTDTFLYIHHTILRYCKIRGHKTSIVNGRQSIIILIHFFRKNEKKQKINFFDDVEKGMTKKKLIKCCCF